MIEMYNIYPCRHMLLDREIAVKNIYINDFHRTKLDFSVLLICLYPPNNCVCDTICR